MVIVSHETVRRAVITALTRNPTAGAAAAIEQAAKAIAESRGRKSREKLVAPEAKLIDLDTKRTRLKTLIALGKERGFHTVERTFRLDAQRKPTADGAADLVRELKDAGAQWLYLPPDSYLGTLAEGIIIPAAMAEPLSSVPESRRRIFPAWSPRWIS